MFNVASFPKTRLSQITQPFKFRCDVYGNENGQQRWHRRSRSDIVVHTPVASVVLNFTPPLHGILSLLSFNQEKTLMGKTGHALQHLITESPYSEEAGLTHLEWDAVQISVQFFQFWASDWTTMSKIGGHFESGQPLNQETQSRSFAPVRLRPLPATLPVGPRHMELYST